MTFTKNSLIEAAQTRTRAAKRKARTAKADLVIANTELDAALAEGKPSKVRIAREHTRSAGTAISAAESAMGTVEGLLEIAVSTQPEPVLLPVPGI